MKSRRRETPETIEVDLAKTVSRETLAKLFVLCRRRGLRFPQGVSFLLEEACKPNAAFAASEG